MATTPHHDVPSPDTEEILEPRYTASGRPVTRGERRAFQIWVIFFLLTLVATLIMYLFDKIYLAITGR